MNFTINSYAYKTRINNFPTGELGVVIPTNLPEHINELTIHFDWRNYGNGGVIVCLLYTSPSPRD